jgi:hypothetical protein
MYKIKTMLSTSIFVSMSRNPQWSIPLNVMAAISLTYKIKLSVTCTSNKKILSNLYIKHGNKVSVTCISNKEINSQYTYTSNKEINSVTCNKTTTR